MTRQLKDGEYYRKITNIGNMVSHLIKFKWDNSLGNSSKNLVEFCEKYKLIEKVPSKIVEVEEEISVYMDKEMFEDCNSPYRTHFAIHYWQILNQIKSNISSIDKYIISEKIEDFLSPIELFKIKGTVKKELNWDWEKGEWV